MKKRTVSIVLIILGILPVLNAQNPINYNGVDSLKLELQKLLKPDEPGAAVLITQNNKIIFEEYYGMANLAKKEKLHSDHMMGIASMSKQFEGMAVLILAEDGKLNLEENIKTYFPDLSIGKRDITIKQLLTHTSGLPELTQNNEFMNNLNVKRSVDDIIDIAFSEDFRHEPGEKYQYCNTGYTIVVKLIEKLSGMSYAEFLKQSIFKPLGMKNTYSCDYQTDAFNAVKRYTPDSTGFKEALNMDFSNLIGGGGIVSNVTDMTKWANALLTGENLPKNYKDMWVPALLNNGQSTEYGLGVGISEHKGHVFYYHPGMGSGMNAVNLIFPEENLSITVIRNMSKPKVTSINIALKAVEYLFGN